MILECSSSRTSKVGIMEFFSGKMFKSVTEASEFYKISRAAIHKSIKEKRNISSSKDLRFIKLKK